MIENKSRQIKIEILALPPYELSPNYSRQAHWGHKAKARKFWGDVVYYYAVHTRNMWEIKSKGVKWQPIERASLKWTFIYGVKRTRDADNLITSVKVGQDALVNAGIILADDTEHLSLEPIEIIVNKERASLTIIEIKEELWKSIAVLDTA